MNSSSKASSSRKISSSTGSSSKKISDFKEAIFSASRALKFAMIVSAMPPSFVVIRSIAILPFVRPSTISASTHIHFLGSQFAFIAAATSSAFSTVGALTRTME